MRPAFVLLVFYNYPPIETSAWTLPLENLCAFCVPEVQLTTVALHRVDYAMKIGMLTTTGEKCGIAAYTRRLIAALQELPETEVEISSIQEGKQPTEHYAEQAKRLNAPDVDVIHIQHEYSFWGSVLPGRWGYWELRYLLKKPIVLTAHTTYDLEDLLHLRTERRPHRWLAKRLLTLNRNYRDSITAAPFVTAFVIVHTEAARQALIARGVQSEFIEVIPTGVPPAVPAPTGGESFRKQFGLQNRRLLTIFGFIAYNKGYELALEILPSLPPETHLVIAGGTRTPDMEPYTEKLRAKIREAGLEPRVTITGFLSDAQVAEAMAASELVLVPHTEATGSYSVTIPLTQGRPVLASDLDCFKEIRSRSDCIELFAAGSATALREAVQNLLSNPERRQELAQHAVEYASETSWPRIAERTREVYERAIKVYRERAHFQPLTRTH